VQIKAVKIVHPLMKQIQAKYLGKSQSVFSTINPLLNKVPGLFIPSEAMASFMTELRQHTIPKGNKICAALILKTMDPKPEATDGGDENQRVKFPIRFDYGAATKWVPKKSKGAGKYVPVSFDVVMMYGSKQDWITMLISLEQLVEILRLNGENVIEYGCLKPNFRFNRNF